MFKHRGELGERRENRRSSEPSACDVRLLFDDAAGRGSAPLIGVEDGAATSAAYLVKRRHSNMNGMPYDTET